MTSLKGFKRITKQVANNHARPMEMIKEMESINTKIIERKIPAMLIKNNGRSLKSKDNYQEIIDDQTFGFVMISKSDLQTTNTTLVPQAFNNHVNQVS